MPDNETNDDNTNKRPKRRAAQRTYVSYENTSVWNEDKDLKRALLASLQDVKKSVSKSTFTQNGKNDSNIVKKSTKSDVFPKLNANNSTQSICKDSQSVVDNNLLSLAAHRRARVSAQRKFASGFTTNSPVSTPIKTGFVAATNVVDLFPNQKPKTEDFLTFLCLRRSAILPPNLDFIRLENERKAKEEKKCETDSENISNNDLENTDKYTTCRLRANVDRRGSSSSTVSKTTSMGSRASLQISNRKKSENQRNDNKNQNSKRQQFLNSENCVKNLGSDLNQNIRQNSKANAHKLQESNPKTFDSLKQKYKQQRIDKKSSNPSKSLNSNKKSESKVIKTNNFKDNKSETVGIQTRQQLRNHSNNDKEFESKDKLNSKDSDSGPSERVLRSNKSVIVSHNNNEMIKSPSLQKTNSKKNKSLNSSQIGIRPKKRKARPMVPLIDYYFDSEFESESEKKNIKKEENNSSDSQFYSKNLKNNSKDNKNKKKSKPISETLRTPSASHPKGTKKSTNKSKTSLSSEPRRLTRSSRPFSPPKDDKDLEKDRERERLLKQRIIEIERKHKRLRRCPSNQSLHSSTSSSSSSSESLPNSLSSSSSINNTRLTRSLEHLKKIRDIAAKLKEQNKRDDKNKNIIKNKVNNRKTKQNVNKRQNSIETQTNESSAKNSKTKKTNEKSMERTVTRSMRDAIVSAMSDTDCDTEGDECEDCEHLISGLSTTEDSMASILDEDMERASIVIQDMAEDINTLLVNSSENDLQYGSTEHIQGLMTCEFSGAFSEETVTTASAILLPTDSHSEYSYVQTDESQIRSTVDASTNTTEDDILSSLSSDETHTDSQYEYSSKTLSVGTQTAVNTSVQTDGPLDC